MTLRSAIVRVLLAVLICCDLSACGYPYYQRLYDGPPLSRGEIAFVSRVSECGLVKVFVVEVLGKREPPVTDLIELPVGTYVLQVALYGQWTEGPVVSGLPRKAITVQGGPTFVSCNLVAPDALYMLVPRQTGATTWDASCEIGPVATSPILPGVKIAGECSAQGRFVWRDREGFRSRYPNGCCPAHPYGAAR